MPVIVIRDEPEPQPRTYGPEMEPEAAEPVRMPWLWLAWMMSRAGW